ncbi:MAG TPA: DUF1573 domain-containing protein [Chitinophagaceae bacterium]|jgi:hypothetical protein|nr:DUF1573 domain-containing protein [Chitinophagaceae bacterium]
MKLFIFCVIITLLINTSCSEIDRSSNLVFKSYELELGTIKFDSTYYVRYTAYNFSRKKINIDTITASCGCTVVSTNKKEIAPGDSSIISIQFSPIDTGNFRKNIVIKSDGDSIFSVVYFAGHVCK